MPAKNSRSFDDLRPPVSMLEGIFVDESPFIPLLSFTCVYGEHDARPSHLDEECFRCVCVLATVREFLTRWLGHHALAPGLGWLAQLS